MVDKERYWANREHYLEKNREYREKNKEKCVAAVKAWLGKNPDYLKRYWKKYKAENKDLIRERQKVSRAKNYEKNKEKFIERRKAYMEKYPERIRANDVLRKAVKRGKTTRPDFCIICGKKCKPVGHHHDYSMPFDVLWVCRPCHACFHTRQT